MANILDKIQLSGITYDIYDSSAIHSLDGYWTSGQTSSAITAATAALAETIGEELSAKTDVSAFTAHTADTDIHVTIADKTAWNAKLDAADIENFFGAVNYDSNSKRINFYNTSTGGTVLAYVDATDFVKDGFLQSVTIENKTISGESVPCMVFIWNTDSGIQETDIPLSGIFDPSNYYTKAEVDAALSAKTDVSAFTEFSASTTSAMTEMSEVTARALNDLEDNKQDTLVNQTNIKSINGNSLLGSGNLEISTFNAQVSGTTLILG